MKLLVVSIAMTCLSFVSASRAVCQNTNLKPQQLHFAISFPEGHRVLFELTASDAKRILTSGGGGPESEYILQLRGNVEVRTTTCPPTGNVCVTSPMVLQADAVDYNEKTGEINARGDVHTSFIDPSPRQPRPQGYAPEPLQRPTLARTRSATSE